MAWLVSSRTILFPVANDGNCGVQGTGIHRLGILGCKREGIKIGGVAVNSLRSDKDSGHQQELLPISQNTVEPEQRSFHHRGNTEQSADNSIGSLKLPNILRKTKTVCTIGPCTSTREMIWKLAEEGMNVARLNMSHGEHESHRKVIDLVKEYNAQMGNNVIGIMLDTKGPEVRSGDLPRPIKLVKGQEFTFTTQRGVSSDSCVSVNYDDFVNDVEDGDIILVDGIFCYTNLYSSCVTYKVVFCYFGKQQKKKGGMMSFLVKSKTKKTVICEVKDGGELKSRRHLNVRGKSATLPSITEKDWEDIKFGVENKVDFFAVSFVKDVKVVHELKTYLKSCGADIQIIPKIESADSIPNLQSIISESDGAMVARGDLGGELPIEDVPLIQEEIVKLCHSMGKPVIVATNMLESMINHPTPTRAEVSDIAIAVREGADAIMLSGETAHGKYPLKAVKMMHKVAIHTEATMLDEQPPAKLGCTFKDHMSEMFAFHATMMSKTLGTSIVVFTRTASMAILLSHYRPYGTIFAFTNEKRVQQRLSLYHGVQPIYITFLHDAEETFAKAVSLLQKWDMLKAGEEVTLVQSGKHAIWRSESIHQIQVRKV